MTTRHGFCECHCAHCREHMGQITEILSVLEQLVATDLDLSLEWVLAPASAADVGIDWTRLYQQLNVGLAAARAVLTAANAKPEAV